MTTSQLMKTTARYAAVIACIIHGVFAGSTEGWAETAESSDAIAKQVARGKYLVEFGGCNDCHTPGYFLGKPDMSLYLSGSNVGFEIPGVGTFVGPNLTPDKETGLGNWTRQEIVTAMQTGVRPDGRTLVPIMPWRAFAKLTKEAADAIADYLKSLPPTRNKAAGPFRPDAKAPIFVMTLRPPEDNTSGADQPKQ